MAAPPPYWKKKTRPCPFYSQGRCLFSDACNFVHSVKITPHNETTVVARSDGNEAFLGGGNVCDGKHISYTAWEENKRIGWDEGGMAMSVASDERRPVSMVPGERPIFTRSSSRTGSSIGSGSLSRTPSEKRRRVVLMSPPRSPRLSGLLSALEPVIGPDVEEVEITDDEDAGEDLGEEGLGMNMGRLLDNFDARAGGARDDGGDRTAPLSTLGSPMTHSSSQGSTSLAYYQDSLASEKDQDIPSSSDNAPSPTSSATNVPPVPDLHPGPDALELKNAPLPTLSSGASSHRPSFRDRVPSRIITQDPDRIGHSTTILDNNTLEVYSHQHHQHHQDHVPHQHQHLQDYHEHGLREQNQHVAEQHQEARHHFNRTSTDDPLSASRGSRRHSTFELLTSPFTSPAHRILSPKIFPVRSPTSPVFGQSVFQLQHHQEGNEAESRRPYADDDVDSLETLESFNDDSNRDGSTSSSHSLSGDSLLRTRSSTSTGSDETSVVTIDTCSSPTAPIAVDSEDVGSPQETERPSSDYSRTPRNHPSINIQSAADVELEMLPPLPLSRADDGDVKIGRRGSLDLKTAPAHNPPATSANDEGSDECSSAADSPALENRRQLEADAPSKGEGIEQMQLAHEEGPAQPMSPPSLSQTSRRSGVESDLPQQQSSDSGTLSLSVASDDTVEGKGFKGSSGDEMVAEGGLSSSGVTVRNGVKEPEGQQEPEWSPDSGVRAVHKTVSESRPIVTQGLEARGGNFSQRGSSQKGGHSETSSCPVDSVAEDPRQPRSAGFSLRNPEQTPQGQGSEELERRLPVEQEQGQDSASVPCDLVQGYSHSRDTIESESEERTGAVRASRTHRASSPQSSSVHLSLLSMPQVRSDSLESPVSLSFGPSPITPDCGSSSSPDAIMEQGAEEDKAATHETILERRARHTSGSPKRLAVVSLTSPTKELRELYFPASLEKTVRPAPSPLYDDSQHSASSPSSVASSPRPSWAELQRRSGVSNKVPFGFRQSLLAEESPSLSQKLASKFSRESTGSRTSSTSSLSPTSASTSAFNPRRVSRVDMLSGRARSVSPALFGSESSFSHRHSIASHSSSAPSLQVGSSSPPTMLPRSASQAEFFADRQRSDSPVQVGQSGDSGPSSMAADRRASWMKPLRLSQVYSPHSRCSSVLSQSNRLSTISTHSSQAYVRNASQGSIVQNTELSSSRSSLISSYLNDSSIPTDNDRTIISGGERSMPSMESVLAGTTASPLESRGTAHHRQETQTTLDLLSPLSGSMRGLNFEELSQYQWPADSTRNSMNGDVTLTESVPPDQPVPPESCENAHIRSSSTNSAPANSSITVPTPCHAIATPLPTLMFAIASDNPEEVERVLANGEARPNDVIGPQSALEFALTNDALVNKTEIVKTLLAFGADVSTLRPDLRNDHDQESAVEKEEVEDVLADLPSESTNESVSKRKKRESVLNPAMKYYLNRATAGLQAAQTNAALRRSDFRNLARMRFDFIGQDRALEHLYWVLGMHSQQPIGTPLVVLCCGPCGHGKSLLARKFGSLLDVPTHTVNMTVLKTSHDLWDCPSMSPYDPPSERTLAEFLEENAGKRCVVVLDEIDKNEDERTLWSLLAPWELGRCSIDSGRRHIDVRNVIWLGTSNIGQDLVFEHHAARKEPDTVMSKAEYRELMNRLRPLVTERLGTSLMSRVTAVLPFVAFTPEEKLAIASEAILSLGGEAASSELTPEDFERLALQCVSEYIESDGARSLYRSVSTHLMEVF